MSFSGASGLIVWLAGLFSVVVSLLWIYIAWRAMRAHEKLAAATDQIAKNDTRYFSSMLTGQRRNEPAVP